MMRFTLRRDGTFYKGNLHAHTTLSDGQLTPDQALEIYRGNGYSFLAFTDHRRYHTFEQYCSPEFLMMPGVELDTFYEGKHHHIVGISTPGRTKLRHGDHFGLDSCGTVPPQSMINALCETGNIAIYAHPFWSYTEPHELCALDGLTGIEVYNYTCDQRWRTGLAELHYEMMLDNGYRIMGLCSDDTHYHTPDTCGGYITVKCASLTHEAVMQAILQGSFFSSASAPGQEAPIIIDFVVENGVAKVDVSPVRDLYLLAGWAKFKSAHFDGYEPLTHLAYSLPDEARQVHAVAVDFQGHISWSQPIWLR